MKKIKNADSIQHTWVGQIIEPAAYYEIQPGEEMKWGNDSTLISAIGAGTAVVNNGSEDITDVNLAITHLKDGFAKEVVTQLEKPDKDLLLASASASFVGDVCTLQIKIPGELGDFSARYVAGGYAFTNIFGWGDRVTAVSVVDKDFAYAGLAYPATPTEAGVPGVEGLSWAEVMPDGVVLGSYTDDFCEEPNRGWRLWCEDGNQGGMDIDPLGGFGKLPALAYITVIIEKTATSGATDAAINVWWGKKND